ncbi:aminodeoxychorismate lyase [Crenobacter intestini]|uniref:aminodeoxychorismate lyase n=1 Tax=Crenobacter intestini TaxID=2563443 RepID=A0A4T0UTM4_9NEIS|nr:aminodeoxychorismate lyase [Crenobacter intestini]TIC82284.1 aminodeoxychorismate lyase [Crenobacter intestini]
MAVRVNGRAAETLPVADRGLAYGDGIFRTVELLHGVPRLWRWHWQRFMADCATLALPLPDEALLLDELARAAEGLPRAVAKLTLTRGAGARGYAMPLDATPTLVVAASPWAGYPAELATDGVNARWCALRLARQPRLAGAKHLNRLENVLARSEWSDPAIREGLLLDSEGWVVEGTMMNVVLVSGGRVLTPLLDGCGVSGALRAWLADWLPTQGLALEEARLRPEDVLGADEVWLVNSLAGVWPVAALGGQRWQDFPLARRAQVALASI